jgi:hypothetical protein
VGALVGSFKSTGGGKVGLAGELKELDEATHDEPHAWAELQEELLECLEGFGPEQSARWLTLNVERRREILANMFDELYTRDFLAKAKKVVERTMLLTAMTPKATPERGVNLYLREATRCCIFGFWDSSVALSRATLELALKHRLKDKLGSLTPTVDDLKLLLEAARKTHLMMHITGWVIKSGVTETECCMVFAQMTTLHGRPSRALAAS